METTKGQAYDTYQEFILFLYIHIANSDYKFKIVEKEIILDKMKRLFPFQYDYKKFLSDITANYKALSQEEKESVLINNFKKFSTLNLDTEAILGDLLDIIYSDDEYHELEKEEFMKLRGLLTKYFVLSSN